MINSLSSASLIFLFPFSACIYTFVLLSAAYLLFLLRSFLIRSNIFGYIMDLRVSDKYRYFITSSVLSYLFAYVQSLSPRNTSNANQTKKLCRVAKYYVVSCARDGITHLG